MEQNVDNKIEFKSKLDNFYNTNKIKIYAFFCILIILVISTIYIKINNEKKNALIAQKYIEAGLYLSSDQKEKSKNIYEEIILSKNKFYSILALYSIIEKDLITDQKKILNYFEIIEKIKKEDEQVDIINFKKALYLIKSGNIDKGQLILKKLIENESKIKALAEEIIIK